MPNRYQDIYPAPPQAKSDDLVSLSAAELLSMEFFESPPGEMPYHEFSQHHILINLNENPHRVENWRDGEHRDFTYHINEIVVTPAGVKSGWKWHARSKAIVVTLEPEKLERFAKSELGILLTDAQLKNIPQFIDEDITQAGKMLLDALHSEMGSAVMFESFARVFLTKLILKYGLEREEDYAFSKSFTSAHYKKVFDFVTKNYGRSIQVEDLAAQAGISTYHFSRLFKQSIGKSPHQFVIAYRVEQAKKLLSDKDRPMIDIALSCGFSDQAHFSRMFKQVEGVTPKVWRSEN
ncbi:helix-turn-helix domain-containing protein [Maridesulfovibrio sp.]|uniref:helix-turn-helix domain-containing protein n=1 Tax=Maridesulfovibrio sp. TaxID=2795000 RepID=UPI003BA96900